MDGSSENRCKLLIKKMVNGAFISYCCAGWFGQPLDSRFRGNDSEGQGGWHGGLL
jgi:hypothetical protein